MSRSNSPFYKNYLYIWQHQVLVAASGHFTVMQGFSSCGAGSVVVILRLSCSTACWDLCCLTGDRTCIPCIAKQILNHWTTKEVPTLLLKALGRGSSLPLPALCGPWRSLACGCITSAFTSVYTWLLPHVSSCALSLSDSSRDTCHWTSGSPPSTMRMMSS